ncbi:LysR substrate-binding domain-containing protein [Ruegeria conchae]|uniref:LysR family glycine cleavage system transcriptional activator n=1 Tax=Ruegeria conchae TaxID=981384 RepID=A0A497YUV4_9RHOB|nr:LysR substrate-binding domain-containing protein [Ruegeria conchae]RLJ98472.1 LysR family glycine cleavage system transcriptional activator [Ruegeria conchae]
MPRNLPPLNPLRAFEAAGRLGSFTRAAEELNVSHSAISRHIRGLEKRLNVHLFRTQKSGVALTEQGQIYLGQITPALDQIAIATDALTSAPKGVVTMTTESAVAQKWLVPRLPRLKAAHQEIDLRLSITTEVMDIEAHDFDLGLRYLRTHPDEGYVLLFPSLVRAFAAPNFAPIVGSETDLKVLATGPLIEEATFRLWPEWFSKSGLKEVPTLDLPHPLGALLSIQSAVAGLGAVLMDKHLCQIEVETGALVSLNDVEIPFGGYYLATNQRAGRRRAVRVVREWLQQEAQSPEGVATA